MTALAEAGYHAVAPDQRGYGKTDCPESIESYDILQLVGDIVEHGAMPLGRKRLP